VGSSITITRASRDRAFAISTICWSAMDSPRAGRSGSIATPSRAKRSDPAEGAFRLAAHDDVLRDREVREQGGLLVDHGDARVDGVGGRGQVERTAVEQHLARVGAVHPGQHLHDRRLAGTVLPDECVDLPGVQGERHVADGRHRPEGLGDGGDGEQRRLRHTPSRGGPGQHRRFHRSPLTSVMKRFKM